MATVVKTWSFASDTEGLADAGNSGLFFEFESADGSPASGCAAFRSATKGATLTEFGRKSTTGDSWETWGVPAGATVTSIQITSWRRKMAASTKFSSGNIKARVIGSGGGSVHSVGDLIDWAMANEANWTTDTVESSRAVDAGSQASTTDVRLELEGTITTSGGGGGANVEERLDEIELTITYTESNPVTVTPGTASLTTSAFAPTVTTTANVLVTPGTASLTTALFAPTVSAPRLVTPGIATLTLATFAPTVTATQGIVVTPGVATLTTALFAPAVSTTANINVIPVALAMSIATFAPAVSAPRLVTPGVAVLSLSAYAPTVTDGSAEAGSVHICTMTLLGVG